MPDQRVRRKSLSDIHNENNIEDLNIRELKEILAANFVDFKGCVERNELIEKVRRLYRDRQNEKLKGKLKIFFSFVKELVYYENNSSVVFKF